MIRLTTEKELWSQKQLDRFVEAVAAGHEIFAEPSTAARMNAEFVKNSLPYRVQSSEFIGKRCVLYTVDTSQFLTFEVPRESRQEHTESSPLETEAGDSSER